MKGFIIYVVVVIILLILRLSLEETTVENPHQTSLDLWTYQQAHQEFYEQMVIEWNEENPEKSIDLNISVLPSEDMHNKLLICATSSKGCPDIADIEVKRFPLFTSGGSVPFKDLTKYIEKYNDGLVQSRLDLYAKNGNYYGIPSHVGAEVMYYNDEILDEANINPHNIITWQDYIEAGYKIKEATGKPMTVIETSENLIVWPILVEFGADIVDENGNLDLDNPTAIDIYKTIQKLISDGVVVVAPGGKVHSEDFYGYMNGGNIASLPMPIWYMSRFTDYMPDLKGKISIYPYPVNPQNSDIQTVGIGGTGTVVFNTSVNPDLSAEFISFAKLSTQGEETSWELLGFDPVNSNIWNDLKVPETFSEYFTTDPLEVLNSYSFDNIASPNNSDNIADITKELDTSAYYRMFEQQEDASKVMDESINKLKK